MREREQTITLQTHLYLRTITCQIRSPDLFITMKQPAAGRQIKTLYLRKKKKRQKKPPLFMDVEKASNIHGLLSKRNQF